MRSKLQKLILKQGKNPDETDTATSNLLPNKMKDASKNKPTGASEKSCICAPTSHAGSFRCRLHRNSAHLRSGDNIGRTTQSGTALVVQVW
ncbi:hypothetical protein F0562_002231 [Nyssa sinensis]|uniref:Uncharacterized protein n=1 Tax=Nyssa sinensis TaxID=561372 RepID=A0A5J5C946_9ASTE|nr:hypothetical protein F0562_002231 [Nyssa sinensis]